MTLSDSTEPGALNLPEGLVCFLFTDVEGSTARLSECGAERYATLLERHRAIVRRSLHARSGLEVSTEGDAFLAVFLRPTDAVGAAVDAQIATSEDAGEDGPPLWARIGIHTCQAIVRNNDYVGLGVHRAARICSAAHGGQVLVSRATRDLLRDEGAAGELLELGSFPLKDFPEPDKLYQVTGTGLRRDFPPLRVGGLPEFPQSSGAARLFGRDAEIRDVVDCLLSGQRLVTLTGPGGVGKTKLAQAVSQQLLGAFQDGAVFVDLSSVTDPQLIVAAIAAAVGIDEGKGLSLNGFLRNRRLLVVLDNFEQVIDGANTIPPFLDSAPGVSMLVTSREALHLVAEQVYPLAPLALGGDRDNTEALLASPAVALFGARAHAADRQFSLDASTLPFVSDICHRLDGLPLAIELAAARVAVLTLEEMSQRLDDPLAFLVSKERDRPARQRTLRDTIEWSYGLLSDDEQRAYRSLAAFYGGFTLAAADAVAGVDLDTLASLMDKGLLTRTSTRFHMLESIHAHATAELNADAQAAAVRAKHAAFFLSTAEATYASRFSEGNDDARLLGGLEEEIDNLRSALNFFELHDEAEYVALAGALGWYWTSTLSLLAEGRRRLGAARALQSIVTSHRARVLSGLGLTVVYQDGLDAGLPFVKEALRVWADMGDAREEGLLHTELAWVYFSLGNDVAAYAEAQRGVELLSPFNNVRLDLYARLTRCQLQVAFGDVETASVEADRALAMASNLPDRTYMALARHFLGDCALINASFATAVKHYREGLLLQISLGRPRGAATEIQGISMSLAGLGTDWLAVALESAASNVHSNLGVSNSQIGFWNELLDQYVNGARRRLGPDVADEARSCGVAWTLEEATERTLAAAAALDTP